FVVLFSWRPTPQGRAVMSRRLLPHEVHVPAWIGASELQAHAEGFIRHLFDQGYRKSTILPYRAAVAHFAHWTTLHKIRGCDLAFPHPASSRVQLRSTATAMASYRQGGFEGAAAIPSQSGRDRTRLL